MSRNKNISNKNADRTSLLSSHLRNPPVWLNRSAYWFRLGLILFSVLALLLGTTACRSSSLVTTSPSAWLPATEITPKETLIKIVRSHSSLANLDSTIKTMKVWQIKGNKGYLNLYQFDNPALCGKIGCLYIGYLVPFEQNQLFNEVFTAYLNSNLPPKNTLIRAETESTLNEMPCLLVTQPTRHGQSQLKFCYNGLAYQHFETRQWGESKDEKKYEELTKNSLFLS